MYKNGFALIFSGMVFVLINIPVSGVDILPDFLGYILFALGYEKLKHINKYFFRVRKFVWLLIMISAAAFYRSLFITGQLQDISRMISELALSLLVMIFTLLNFHDLFYGIKHLADMNSYRDISAEAQKRWKHVVILNILAFLLLLMIQIPLLNILYIVSFIVFSVYLTVSIMKLLWKCMKLFKNE